MITTLKDILNYVISPLFIILNVLAYYFAIYDSLENIIHATYAIGLDDMIRTTISECLFDSTYVMFHNIEVRIIWALDYLLTHDGVEYIIYLCTPLVEVIVIDIVFLMAAFSTRRGIRQYITITDMVHHESIKDKTIRIYTYIENVIVYTITVIKEQYVPRFKSTECWIRHQDTCRSY